MWCTWLFPLILLFGSAIIGCIIGWLLRNREIKELNEHNESLTNKFNQELSVHKKTITTLESDATSLNQQKADWETKFLAEQKNATNWESTAKRNEGLVKELNLSVTNWEGKYNTTNTKAIELAASLEAQTKSVASLEEQIKQLKLNAIAEAEKATEKYEQLAAQFKQLELDKQQQEDTYKTQLTDSENKYHTVNTKAIELATSLEEQTKSVASLEEQIRQLKLNALTEAKKAAEKHEQLATQFKQLELDKQALSNDLESSKQEIKNNLLELAASEEKYKKRQLDIEQITANYNLLRQRFKTHEATTERQKKKYEQDLDQLNKKLTAESKNLEAANKEIERLTALLKQLEEQAQKELDNSPPLSKEDATLKRIKEKAKHLDFERIGLATYATRDDLKTIKGIGPFIEKKLHALGIYTFLQISNLTPDDQEKVNEAIEFFSGRIKRDLWVKQGNELHEEKLEKEKEEEKKKDKK